MIYLKTMISTCKKVFFVSLAIKQKKDNYLSLVFICNMNTWLKQEMPLTLRENLKLLHGLIKTVCCVTRIAFYLGEALNTTLM